MNTRTTRTLAPLFIALTLLTFATVFFMPQKAHACSEVTWQYDYFLQPNPFIPGTPIFNAFESLYGINQTIQSEYQYAVIGDDDGRTSCYEPTDGIPTVSIIAVPSSINSGETSQLSWVSNYTTSCTGTNFDTASYTAGNSVVSPPATLTYTVTCTNGIQSATASATVTVNPPSVPTVSLTATPSSIVLGGSSVLAWTSTNAVACSLDQGIGSVSPNSAGQRTVSPSSTLTYSITCYGAGGASVAMQGAQQCTSVGTQVGSWGDTQDGVGFTGGTSGLQTECEAITPVGGCCQVQVREVTNSTGNPVNTYYTGKAYSSGVLTQKDSYTTNSGSNHNNYNFFAGLATAGLGTPVSSFSTVTVVSLPDLQVGDINGGNYVALNKPQKYFAFLDSLISFFTARIAEAAGSPVAGQPAKLWVAITNPTVTAVPQTFYNKFYIDLNNDNASAPGGMPAQSYGGWDTTYDAPLSGISSNTSKDAISLIPAGLPAGTHAMVFCADVTNTVSEQNESDNCTPKTIMSVTSPYSCSASPTSVTTSQSVTWTATVPATGTYTYSWSGTNSLSGTTKSVTKTYTTTGTKTASVTITSGGISTPVTCSNSAVVSATLSDLSAGGITPGTAVATVAKTFQSTITNNSSASTGNSYSVLFQRATDSVGTGATDIGTVVLTATAGNTSKTASVSYTFPSAGTWYVRAYADKASSVDTGTISESNENNNNGTWTQVVVSSPTLSASCSTSPTSGYIGDTIIWTATPSGGTGVYTYSWTGADALSGTGASVSKSYTSNGSKTASVTVSSGGNSATVVCAPITISNPPTALLSANPSTIIFGASPSVLTWSSSDAVSCSSTKFNTGNTSSGSASVSPAQNTTYDLTCTDGTRNAFSNATVTVIPINLTLNVSPQKVVRQGNPATVTWSVVGSPDTCLISGPGLSSTAFSGSQQVIITKESTYLFTCTVSGVSASKSVTIGLTPHFEEF